MNIYIEVFVSMATSYEYHHILILNQSTLQCFKETYPNTVDQEVREHTKWLHLQYTEGKRLLMVHTYQKSTLYTYMYIFCALVITANISLIHYSYYTHHPPLQLHPFPQ